jgi:hypothetical protein
MKLKYSQVKDFRQQQLDRQHHRCGLCGDPVDDQEAVLDHDHKSGLLRGVLHRGCNSLLGKIENAMPRSRVNLDRLAAISMNLIKYLTADPVSEFLHPTYKTPEETAMKKKKGRGRGRGR